MNYLKKFEKFIYEKHHMKYSQYNKFIDYTSLTESETEEDIIELCDKAIQLRVKSVCVYPKWVKKCSELLSDSDVLVCTVVSFPSGTNSLQEKISETEKVIRDGADEVDMVLDYQYLKNNWNDKASGGGDLEIEKSKKLVEEVEALTRICHANKNKNGEPVILKVIVESGLLTLKQTEVATIICLEAGADFIKTSTGKVSVGAELDKVKIMEDTIIKYMDEYHSMKIKASGGIRTIDDIEKFGPYVERFGMGYGSVDEINGIESTGSKY